MDALWHRFFARSFGSGLFWLAASLVLPLFIASPAHAQASVCAQVRIEIQQTVSLERQAFDAVLRINNGSTTTSVESVSVNILFEDAQGNPVVATSDPNDTTAMFFVRLASLDGIDAVDGTGSVAPSTTGEVHWVIIPSADAGGDTSAGEIYFVGATLDYTLGGEPKSVEVAPDTISVRPQPRLVLDYFLAGDVYADDAFTPEVEAPVPFPLGVRIRNVGAGIGRNIKIASAQPEIVDNEQGLLIGFTIIGSYVDAEPASPSLQLDFGDIQPGGVRMGRWLMETTLSGQFIGIDASYTHAGSLGGALTSLIEGQPESHLLVHEVLVSLPGRDDVEDFLAKDEDVLRVYESSGIDNEVSDRSAEAALTPITGSPDYRLSFPETPGFSYVKLADPTNGASHSLSVRRSDDSVLVVQNAWFSKERMQDNSWSYFVNFFDANGGGEYTVTFDSPSSTGSLSGEVYADQNADGIRDANEPGLDEVAMVLVGDTPLGAIQKTTSTHDGGIYQFTDLPQGSYEILVGDVASYRNGIHQAGTSGGVVNGESISAINLAAESAGTGYVFAKVPVDVSTEADLELISIQAQTQIETDQETSIVVQAGNSGPQAALAEVLVELPATFVVDHATPSVGSFNLTGRIWSIGALTPGQSESLEILGHYADTGNLTLGAAIHSPDVHSVDPDSSNDDRTLSVTVEPAQLLTVDVSSARVSDLLLWVSCSEGAPANCVQQRAARWDALFSGAGIRHAVAPSLAQFESLLRSGEWTSVWIDGGLGLESGTLSAEVRESVRRGGALILSGTRNSAWDNLEGLAGASFASMLPDGQRQVSLLPNEYFASGVLSANGSVATYNVDTGRELAEYTSGETAIAASLPDTGSPVLVFGFDPLPGIEALADPTGFVKRFASGAAVVAPDVVLDDMRLPVAVEARRSGTASGEVAMGIGFPLTFEVLDVSPLPTLSDPGSLIWSIAWPAEESRVAASCVLRTPANIASSFTLVADAQWQTEQDADQWDVQIRTLHAQEVITTEAVEGMLLTNSGDAVLLDQVHDALNDAKTAYAQGGQQDAITALVTGLDALDSMASPEAPAVALEMSRLLLAMSRDDPQSADAIFADGFEGAP